MSTTQELDIDHLFSEAEGLIDSAIAGAPADEDLVADALEAADPLPLVRRMSQEQKLAFNAKIDEQLADDEERYAIQTPSILLAEKKISDVPLTRSPQDLLDLKITPRNPLFVLRGTSDATLAERDYGMVFAQRGAGKTMWILSQALALASGGVHANMKAVQPRRVLLVDGEMPLTDMASRIQSFIRGMTPAEVAEAEENFRILSWEDFEDGIPSLSGPEGWTFIDKVIEALDPAVVYLDNISSLAGGTVENDESAWGPVGDWAKAHRKERSFVWVHHASRGGTARGTSKREDPMDFVLYLKQPPGYGAEDGACFETIHSKSRGRTGEAAETRIFRLHNDETTKGRICTWNEVGRAEVASKALSSKLDLAIPIVEALLRQDPTLNSKTIRPNAREAFKEAHNAGIANVIIAQAFRLARAGGEE